jgi:hypothetical protein
MENLGRKVNLDNHYQQLKGMGAFIDKAIDEQVELVYDELKSYIEGLVCCDKIHHNILDREARFEHAMTNLKFLVWQKLHDKTTNTPTEKKKQAKIIFYNTDQTTTCYVEDEDGHATINNPYGHIEEERKKNNYYGLSTTEYKKLLENDGYEWVIISHNGSYGSEVWSKSDGYVFKGKYKNLKVGDKYYNCCGDTIHIKK